MYVCVLEERQGKQQRDILRQEREEEGRDRQTKAHTHGVRWSVTITFSLSQERLC